MEILLLMLTVIITNSVCLIVGYHTGKRDNNQQNA